MKTSILTIWIAAAAVTLIFSGGINAKSDVQETIVLNSPEYARHTKGLVKFEHLTHSRDYQISCGECHHDEKGTALELKQGDDAERCIACHQETEKESGTSLSKKEKIMKYHKEALHANCIECHKSFNIEKGDPKGKGPAPVSCNQCHPKQ